jgi:hypothetical protein
MERRETILQEARLTLPLDPTARKERIAGQSERRAGKRRPTKLTGIWIVFASTPPGLEHCWIGMKSWEPAAFPELVVSEDHEICEDAFTIGQAM